jgi:hypothetical protein
MCDVPRVENERKIFLLSPAHCGGRRAAMLMKSTSGFDLAQRVRSPGGAPLGEVFTFLSGLYFRGKLEYARRFAGIARDVLVITTNRGLLFSDQHVTVADLESFGMVDIAAADSAYTVPLQRDCQDLLRQSRSAKVILLGSVATGKYVDLLLDAFGNSLVFPSDFVGRGDMSRGALLLRAAANGTELEYQQVKGAIRRGSRAPGVGPR